MTDGEKSLLVQYRQQGKGCAEIARLLNMSANTVKSFLQRNRVVVKAAPAVPITPAISLSPATPAKTGLQMGCCKQCGISLTQAENGRGKQFCSDKCRLQWWHGHRDRSKGAVAHICPVCGKQFSTDRTQIYCSHECYIQARFGRKNQALEDKDR